MGLSPLGTAQRMRRSLRLVAAAVACSCRGAAAEGFDCATAPGIVVWSHSVGTVAGNGTATSDRAAATTVVLTNAPVLRWNSSVTVDTARGPAAVLAYRVNVSAAPSGSGLIATWSSGDVRVNVLPTWIGLAAYEGQPLAPSMAYSWTAEEQLIVRGDGTVPSIDDDDSAAAGWQIVGGGSFSTPADLIAARDEAAATMSSPNVSALWNSSWHSVLDRAAPSGFLPTSVSGGCMYVYLHWMEGCLLPRGTVVC